MLANLDPSRFHYSHRPGLYGRAKSFHFESSTIDIPLQIMAIQSRPALAAIKDIFMLYPIREPDFILSGAVK